MKIVNVSSVHTHTHTHALGTSYGISAGPGCGNVGSQLHGDDMLSDIPGRRESKGGGEGGREGGRQRGKR